jgi:C-terminal processing protease CtpA/Prc
MNKQYILIPALFTVIAIITIAILNARYDDEPPTPTTSTDDVPMLEAEVSPQLSTAPQVVTDSTEFDQIQALETKLASLEARVLELEQVIDSQPETDADTKIPAVDIRLNRLLTTKTLVKAGLSEDMAADIVRRRNDIELRKLELRDRASREDYLGTTRYSRELTALINEQVTLREELGDAAYDRYLYANGMPNRVKVTSVMLGSAAETAGMGDGDIILTYEQNRIFGVSELVKLTSLGELGEYVSIDISRDGQLMSLWVPRGPLGVRLGISRVKP